MVTNAPQGETPKAKRKPTNAQRIGLLERQQALTVEVLKLVLQGRWVGEMPHAEALLKAVSPGDTEWQAVPFVEPEA